jgi:threonine aldolase
MVLAWLTHCCFKLKSYFGEKTMLKVAQSKANFCFVQIKDKQITHLAFNATQAIKNMFDSVKNGLF